MNLHHSFWLTGYLDRRELFTWMHEKKFKKRKKYQRGFVPQTSSPLPLSWRQRHWPVSPWCDALIYVTLAPPLSSGRVATMGWSEQKKHINKYTRIHTETESLCATLSFYCSVIQKSSEMIVNTDQPKHHLSGNLFLPLCLKLTLFIKAAKAKTAKASPKGWNLHCMLPWLASIYLSLYYN